MRVVVALPVLIAHTQQPLSGVQCPNFFGMRWCRGRHQKRGQQKHADRATAKEVEG